MFDLIAGILAFFYSLFPSYAFAIIGLTLVVMVVFTPLTFKSTKSMMAMQRLQPEIKRLQTKHKGGDRQALNEEMMALYQKHGVNPLAGCFPILLQMPVFLVLFRVLRGLTRRTTSVGFGFGSRQAQVDTEGVVRFAPEQPFNPEYLDTDSDLYQDLSVSSEMESWGLNLADSAQSVLGDSIISAIPYLILIAVVGFTGWYQQRQIQGRRSPGAEINPQQQMIMKIMPIFLPVISFGLPAALVIYFLVSNLFRLGQQGIITKRFYGDDADAMFPEVQPLSDEEVEEAAKSAAKKKAAAQGRGQAAAGAGEGISHGSRRPTNRKPPRSKNPNRNGDSTNGSSNNGSNAKKKASGGGRVTPKGEQSQPQSRKKKKR